MMALFLMLIPAKTIQLKSVTKSISYGWHDQRSFYKRHIAMTREDALKKALALCAARGVDACRTLVAYKRGPGIAGLWKAFFSSQEKKTRTWVVLTNMDRKGGNNVFEFDATTGELISDKFVLR